VSPEGHESKASKEFVYSLGGFFVRGGEPMATGDVKRKLTAIFSADVEGYSRLMEEDELTTIETLTSHKETMRKVIKQFRGRVVDSIGDNLLAEFSSVVDAVQCAVEVQQVLGSKNETLPENRRMYFRIGINLGDVVEEGELLYGDGVNVAARVEGLAEGGGISISGTAYDQLGKKLPLGYEYLGEQSVKNIEKPVRVYRVLTEAEAAGKVIGEDRPRRWRWVPVGAAFIVVIVAAAIWNFYLRPTPPPGEVATDQISSLPLPDKPSIAVLPFVNMTGDLEQEYLGDGITEQIITNLSKIPKLFVIASHSTFTYKRKPVKVRQVGQDLGVRYVLEGNVHRTGDRVKIEAQLTDAMTANQLWTEDYDKALKDIFAVQDEIMMKIIASLKIELTEEEKAHVYERATLNLEAYLKWFQGLNYFLRQNKDDNALARQVVEEAIALDPQFASGYALLAYIHLYDARYGWSRSPANSMGLAVELAKKTLALDVNEAGARALLGHIHLLQGQYAKAIAEGQKAVSVDPNAPRYIALLALTLCNSGNPKEAIVLLKKAIRLNPKPPAWYLQNLGRAYLLTGQFEEAITAYKKVLRLNPDYLAARTDLAATYILLGREDEALAQAARILKINPEFSLEYWAKTLRIRNQADLDLIIGSLRKAGLPETSPLELPDKPSIAVLPFANVSGNPKEEYLSDGIAEQIITALSKVPHMFVIARNSSFTYKGKPVMVQQVGQELGVRYVLEGSTQRSGDRVRITAQLIDAQTGHHLWAERYDRDLKDIFALQDEITMKVITALQVNLTEREQARIYRKGTNNLDAYLKFLKAREQLYRMNIEGNTLSRQILEEVIAIDPNYSMAHRFLGSTYMMDVWFGATKNPRQSLAGAIEIEKKAIALDDTNASAHGILSLLYTMTRHYEKGIAEGELAIALDPNSADAHGFFAMTLRFAGRPKEAIALLEKAIRLNPFPPTWYYQQLGGVCFLTGQYDDAISAFKKALQSKPNNLFAHIGLAMTYVLSEREEEARAEAAAVLRINPKFSLKRFAKTLPYKTQADTDLQIDALRKAGLE
jgi:adenylate cyclase